MGGPARGQQSKSGALGDDGNGVDYKMAIVTEDLIDKELKALFKTGGYRSEKAAVGHALEVLLAANPTLRLGVAGELYGTGEVTLARAAEIGGISVEVFKDYLPGGVRSVAAHAHAAQAVAERTVARSLSWRLPSMYSR